VGFLGGFFWVGFLLPTLPAGPPSRCAAPRSCRRRRESSGRAWRARKVSPAAPGSPPRSATGKRLKKQARIDSLPTKITDPSVPHIPDS
jgi:hypothetical protein